MVSKSLRARVVLCIATLSVAGSVFAAEGAARKYAVLSLVGDEITMVVGRPSTGSSMDRNERQSMPIQNASIDDAAASSAGETIKGLEPGSTAFVLAWREPGLFELQESAFKAQSPYLDALKGVLKKTQSTHLLLITKHRADVQMRFVEGATGHGKLRGVGFYLDALTPIRLGGSGETGTGFLAPYAYVTLSLLDADGTLIRHHSVVLSNILPTAGTSAINAWGVLTAQQKIKALQDTLGEAVAEAVPRVLDPR